MRPVIRMHACDYNHSAAQGAQWQELELIFSQLLQHGNMRERRERVVYALLIPTETFMHVCLTPSDAARFCVRKCANNHQLIVAGVQRFLRQAGTAHLRVMHTCKMPCALCIIVYICKHWLAYFSYTETVTCMCVLHRMKSVLLGWTPSLNDRSKLKAECTDVQSGWGTSVGPSPNPHSLS